MIKNHRVNQSKATDELSFINAPANSNITAEKIRDPGIYVEDWAHCLGEEGMRGLTDDLTSEDQMDGWTPHRCLWYGGGALQEYIYMGYLPNKQKQSLLFQFD